MTRKDYQVIAEIIATLSPEIQPEVTVQFCKELRKRNPQFKPDRFTSAVDMEYAKLR